MLGIRLDRHCEGNWLLYMNQHKQILIQARLLKRSVRQSACSRSISGGVLRLPYVCNRILQNMKSCGLSAPRWHESPSPPAAGASGGDAGSAGGSAGGPAANPSKHTPREARRQVPGGAAGGAAGGLAANPPKNRRVSVVVLRPTTLTRVTSVVVRQRSTDNPDVVFWRIRFHVLEDSVCLISASLTVV